MVLRWNIVYFIVLMVNFEISAQRAVITVPVADLVGNSILHFGLDSSVKKSYKKIAICGGPQKPWNGSPRIHQALFNEIVEVVDTIEHPNDVSEVCITHPSIFFVTHDNKKRNIFWTLKSNLLILDSKIDSTQIPAPLSFNKKFMDQNSIVTLSRPFYEGITKKTYSGGTRFVSKEQKNKMNIVYIYDTKNEKMITAAIPDYYIAKKYTDPDQKISYFVRLLKLWACPKNGFIPYIWGGASFTSTADGEFCTDNLYLSNGKKTQIYCKNNLKSCFGFDCSGLVLRAAQTAGIPFFYKNTTTMAKYMREISPDESIQNGDLIWIPGHVMIVSDAKNNRLIEARGYSHGYGIVHEIDLAQVFSKIDSYEQLKDSLENNICLQRLDHKGQIVEDCKELKILKLASIWEIT